MRKKYIIITSLIALIIGIIVVILCIINNINQNNKRQDENITGSITEIEISSYVLCYAGEDKVIQSEETIFPLKFGFSDEFFDENDIAYIKLYSKGYEGDSLIFEKDMKISCDEMKKDAYEKDMFYNGLTYDSSQITKSGHISIETELYNSENEIIEYKVEDMPYPNIIANYDVKDGEVIYSIQRKTIQEFYDKLKEEAILVDVMLEKDCIIPREKDWRVKLRVRIPKKRIIEYGGENDGAKLCVRIDIDETGVKVNNIYADGNVDVDIDEINSYCYVYVSAEEVSQSEGYYIEKDIEVSFNTENISIESADSIDILAIANVTEKFEEKVLECKNWIDYTIDDENNVRYIPTELNEGYIYVHKK